MTVPAIIPELSTPLLPLTPFSAIPRYAVDAIESLIDIDEGGWQLEQDPEDNDGGWTYGGITAKLFQCYFQHITVSQIHTWSKDGIKDTYLMDTCVSIYYQAFYHPLQLLAGDHPVDAAHLSCAINCGGGGEKAVELMAGTKHDLLSFLSAWKDHYFQILAGDPTKVKYIHGWINRVWKYIPADS